MQPSTKAIVKPQRSRISMGVRQSLSASPRASRLGRGALAVALTLGAIGAVHAQEQAEEIIVTGSRVAGRTTMDSRRR